MGEGWGEGGGKSCFIIANLHKGRILCWQKEVLIRFFATLRMALLQSVILNGAKRSEESQSFDFAQGRY